MASPRPNKRKKTNSNSENINDDFDYQNVFVANNGDDDDGNISDSELVRASQILESKFNYANFNDTVDFQNRPGNGNFYMNDGMNNDDIKQLKADNFQKAGEVKMLREKHKKLEQEMNKVRNEKNELLKQFSTKRDETDKVYKKQLESKELELKFKTQEVVELQMKLKVLESKHRKDGHNSLPQKPLIVNENTVALNETISLKPVVAVAPAVVTPAQEPYVRKMKLRTKNRYPPDESQSAVNLYRHENNEICSLELNVYYYQLIDKFKNSVSHFNNLFNGGNCVLNNSEKAKDYLMFEKSLHELNNNINHLLHKVNYSQQKLSKKHQHSFQISSNLCKTYMNLVLSSLNQTLKAAVVKPSDEKENSETFMNISYLLLEILVNLSQYETFIFSGKPQEDQSMNLKHELSVLISYLLKSSACLSIEILNSILIVFNQLLAKSDSQNWLELLHNVENKNQCLFYMFYEKLTKFFLEESYRSNSDNSSVTIKREDRFIFNILSFYDLYFTKLTSSAVPSIHAQQCLCKKDMINSFSSVIDYLIIKKYLISSSLKSINEDLNNNYLIFLCKLIQLILLLNNNCKLIQDDLLFDMMRDDYRYKNFVCLMLVIDAHVPKKFKHLNFSNIKAFLKSAMEICL